MTRRIAILAGVLLSTPAYAARDSSGTWVVPGGVVQFPFVSGTRIYSPDMNLLLNDLGQEITYSLSRNGQAGMLAPLRLTAGSATVPALSWSAETNSGFYRASSGDLRLSINNADQFGFKANRLDLYGTGTSGIYRDGGIMALGTISAHVLYLVQAGAYRWAVNTSGDLQAYDGTHTVTNLKAPSASADAATKAYVDAHTVAAAGCVASDGTLGSVLGPVSCTAGNCRTGLGSYVVSVTGMSTASIVAASPNTSFAFLAPIVTADTLTVAAGDTTGSTADKAFCFVVGKL